MKTFRELLESIDKSGDMVTNHAEIAKLHPDAKKKFDELHKRHKGAIASGKVGIHATISKPDSSGNHDMDIHVHKTGKLGEKSTSNGTATTAANSTHGSNSFSLVHHKSLKFHPSATWNGGHYTSK